MSIASLTSIPDFCSLLNSDGSHKLSAASPIDNTQREDKLSGVTLEEGIIWDTGCVGSLFL